MCVTNFFKRNPRAVAVAAKPEALSKAPSVISQRLHGSFLPMLANAPIAKPASVVAFNNNIYSSTSAHGFPVVIGNNYELPKQKPKRKRKPQKPGLTAKASQSHAMKARPFANIDLFLFSKYSQSVIFSLTYSNYIYNALRYYNL
jgi:hypothetical protein